MYNVVHTWDEIQDHGKLALFSNPKSMLKKNNEWLHKVWHKFFKGQKIKEFYSYLDTLGYLITVQDGINVQVGKNLQICEIFET